MSGPHHVPTGTSRDVTTPPLRASSSGHLRSRRSRNWPTRARGQRLRQRRRGCGDQLDLDRPLDIIVRASLVTSVPGPAHARSWETALTASSGLRGPVRPRPTPRHHRQGVSSHVGLGTSPHKLVGNGFDRVAGAAGTDRWSWLSPCASCSFILCVLS